MMPTKSNPSHQVLLDRTRFPMIWVNALEAYISYLPVTKIQLEYFLCDRPEPRFDQKWYERLLAANERISPGKIMSDNFFKVFATGISPSDAAMFAEWMGNETEETYSLLTRNEWFDAFEELETKPALAVENFLSPEQPARVGVLLTRIDAAVSKLKPADRRLVDSMLMRGGVFEWVSIEEDQWGGAGMPNEQLKPGLINLAARRPKTPAQMNPAPAMYGFRLIKRQI